jgi:Xaa-Pro aminopeptidase
MPAMDRDALRDLLRWENVDAVLACRPWDAGFQANVHYLVGHLLREWDYSGLFGIVHRDGPPVAVTNRWCPADPTGAIEVRTYPGYHLNFAFPVLAATLRDLGLAQARIGIESMGIPVAILDALRAANPNVTFVPGDRIFARLRMRKSAAEIAAVSAAVSAAEAAIMAAVVAAKPGHRLADVQDAAMTAPLPQGSRLEGVHLSIFHPDGTEMLDLPPTITPGTVLTIDLCGIHDLYRADMARQIACEPPSDEIGLRADAVAAMQDAMIGAVRPGLSLRDAYAAATRAAAPWSGADPMFIFQLHGIGLETHEPPRFCSPNEPYFPLPDDGAPDDVPIDSGAVVCLELGMGGLWTEDLFLLTADGAERLTTLPRAILSSNQ